MDREIQGHKVKDFEEFKETWRKKIESINKEMLDERGAVEIIASFEAAHTSLMVWGVKGTIEDLFDIRTDLIIAINGARARYKINYILPFWSKVIGIALGIFLTVIGGIIGVKVIPNLFGT